MMVIQWTWVVFWTFSSILAFSTHCFKNLTGFIIRYEDYATMDSIQRATTMLESRWIQAMVRCHFPQLLPPKQSSVQEQHMSAVGVHGTNSLCSTGCVIKTHIQEEVFAKLSITCSYLKYKYNETSYMPIYARCPTWQLLTSSRFLPLDCDKSQSITWANICYFNPWHLNVSSFEHCFFTEHAIQSYWWPAVLDGHLTVQYLHFLKDELPFLSADAPPQARLDMAVTQ